MYVCSLKYRVKRVCVNNPCLGTEKKTTILTEKTKMIRISMNLKPEISSILRTHAFHSFYSYFHKYFIPLDGVSRSFFPWKSSHTGLKARPLKKKKKERK